MTLTSPAPSTAAPSNYLDPHWIELARYLLVLHVAGRTTTRPGRTTTYLDFYNEMRGHGWPVPALPTTGQLGNNWGKKVGQLLFEVTRLNKIHGEPMLASAVRHASDGKVGDGYPGAAQHRYGYTPVRYAEHAYIEFSKCRRVFV